MHPLYSRPPRGSSKVGSRPTRPLLAEDPAREREALARARRALADSERRMRALTDHLQHAVEAERAAMAREVHDEIGGLLAALRFDLSWMERHADGPIATRARQAMDTLDQAVVAVQRVIADLRPPALDAGIVAALEVLASRFGARTGIVTRLASNLERIELSEQVAITVYRVAQESLTNVAKHARASRAQLDLMVQDDTLSLEITDDGVGLRAGDLEKPSSFGLRGLAERARQVGGWLDVAVGEQRCAVMLTIPLSAIAASRLHEETGT